MQQGPEAVVVLTAEQFCSDAHQSTTPRLRAGLEELHLILSIVANPGLNPHTSLQVAGGGAGVHVKSAANPAEDRAVALLVKETHI